MQHDIQVLKVRSLEKGSLKGFADILIDGAVEVHSLRIIQQEGAEAWVAPPSEQYTSNGKQSWRSIVQFPDRGLRDAVQDAVLKAWRG